MKFLINTYLGKNYTGKLLSALFCFIIIADGLNAQRNFNLVYSDNIKGGTAIFGNTLLQVINKDTINTIKMNDNSINGNSIYGNDNENMLYVDVDGNNSYGAETVNSSTSDLKLPAGINNIKLARLYWGGRIRNSDFDLTDPSNQTIKVRKDTIGEYSTITAMGIDKLTIVSGYTQYQAYADITDFVKNNGGGTYEAGNAPLSIGAIDNGGNNGGWCIMVVYENETESYNSVRVYDGFTQVYSTNYPPYTTITLNGLDVPSGTLATNDAKFGMLAWEGDANLNGDYLKINDSLLSNQVNQPDNLWNGTISDNGINVTSKNPNYTNQMGLDIDQFDVGTGYNILPNANSVTLTFGTTSDKYYPGLITFAIKMKDPSVNIDDSVEDANHDNVAQANEILTYTLSGKNSGLGNANSVVITDTLPNNVTYIPNSLYVINAPGVATGSQTDAAGDDIAEYNTTGQNKTIRFRIGTGATKTNGGTINANEEFKVQFKVRANSNTGINNEIPPIINVARIQAFSDANENFVDDGTAIINAVMNGPEGGALPITMLSFTASPLPNNKVQLNWSTAMEINCSHYEVERSIDGNNFKSIGSVAANGTTYISHSYSFIDDINALQVSSIFYKIEEFDNDGKSVFSKVVQLKFDDETGEINISPNPFGTQLHVSMNWGKSEIIVLKVINVQGQEVISKNVQMNKGNNFISINDLSKMPSGNYLLQIISGNKNIVQKIIKL